jgi:hypothetical protein
VELKTAKEELRMKTNERTAESTVQERAQNEFLKEIAPKSLQLQDINKKNFALIERTPCTPNGASGRFLPFRIKASARNKKPLPS